MINEEGCRKCYTAVTVSVDIAIIACLIKSDIRRATCTDGEPRPIHSIINAFEFE